MIEAVVFDMDGLMIDSQPYWQDVQLDLFSQLGVPITRQDTIDTTGMRIDQIAKMYFEESPWDADGYEDVCNRMVLEVTELVRTHKPAMPGLNHALEVCQQQGLKLAIASSSPMSLIDATIDALQLEGVFVAKSSGEGLRYAKPHPEVYLNACDALKVEPQSCLAIEDSFVGLLAAKSARMKTVIIPDSSVAHQQQFIIADQKLTSLSELTSDLIQSL